MKKPINEISQIPWRIVKNKYNAKKTSVDGITFDSIKEAKRYRDLKILREAGEVTMFIRQPLFDLPGGTKYKADFMIFWTSGLVEVEDVKGGKNTKAYRDFVRAKKQVEAIYPITIIER